MQIDFNEVYSKIDEIISSYDFYHSVTLKSTKDEFSQKYKKEVQDCLNSKNKAVKDSYIKMKSEIKFFTNLIIKFLNLVVEKKELDSEINFHKNLKKTLYNKILSTLEDIKKFKLEQDRISKEIDELVYSKCCMNKLELVNMINNNSIKKYIECEQILDEYNGFNSLDRLSFKIEASILNNKEIRKQYDVLSLKKAQLTIEKEKYEQFQQSYKKLMQFSSLHLDELNSKNRYYIEQINDKKEFLNKYIYENLSGKTVDIIYHAIILGSKSNITHDFASDKKKRVVISNWIRFVVYGGE